VVFVSSDLSVDMLMAASKWSFEHFVVAAQWYWKPVARDYVRATCNDVADCPDRYW
jgi:hypothetical protein